MSAHQTTAPLVQVKPRAPAVRVAWTLEQVAALYDLPFNELMFQAQETHRQYFPEGDVELATLLSIKTGGCPEDCG
jgi:biotin synthase